MKTIRVVTDIAAPVETVWAELSQVDKYAEWNPFITVFQGELVTGSRVKVRIAPPGGRAMTFKPTITVLEERQRLEWLGRLVLPRVFDGRHSFHLETLDEGRTRLTQSEHFSGLLVPLTRTLLEKTRAGFEAMNEALRLRAEKTATPEVQGGTAP
jgi:hypothetical protein